jgi:hypothetical protein
MGAGNQNRAMRARLAVGWFALLALLVAPIAVAGSSSEPGEPQANTSASVKKQIKKLKAQLKALEQTVAELDLQPGAQGPQGPPGPSTTLDAWNLGGNAGTDPTDFLGTSDNQPLNVRVNGARAIRLEPASDGTNVSPNMIGGIADNAVSTGVFAATIGGGGREFPGVPASANLVTDSYGTVGGGAANQAGDATGSTTDADFATVAGGQDNVAGGSTSTIGGGAENTANAVDSSIGGGTQNVTGGQGAAVGGGDGNEATGSRAAIGGGASNEASGTSATVPGGSSNVAAGGFSMAAGRRAQANHNGTFVWADSTVADMASTEQDQFIARATGGFFLQDDSSLDDQGGFINTSTEAFLSTTGVWVNGSDESSKQDFASVDPSEVLDEVADLPVRSWAYKADPDVRHIGPTAQDFHAAFGLGEDDRHIGTVDADGVALAAIKGLNLELEEMRGEVASSAGDRSSGAAHLPIGLLAAIAAIAAALGAGGAVLALRRLEPRKAGTALRMQSGLERGHRFEDPRHSTP